MFSGGLHRGFTALKATVIVETRGPYNSAHTEKTYYGSAKQWFREEHRGGKHKSGETQTNYKKMECKMGNNYPSRHRPEWQPGVK